MNKPVPVVCFGDSITHCEGYAEADQWPVQLALRLDTWRPGGFAVFNRGIGGNTCALGLDRIQTDVIPLLPGLVLIEFGINDAYVNPWARIARTSLIGYRDNLGEIIRQIREVGGQPVLIINHPITRQKEYHPKGNGLPAGQNLEPYNEAAPECASQACVPSIDLPALQRGQRNHLGNGFAWPPHRAADQPGRNPLAGLSGRTALHGRRFPHREHNLAAAQSVRLRRETHGY